ncbi:MAG: septal ring lytic transglycosylase RlpA family protein [Desulfuromonadaceae bacterium]|nr:septal ring lytic transglycosylase RlpA family protein [Desulfuromonadaceae bacterium]
MRLPVLALFVAAVWLGGCSGPSPVTTAPDGTPLKGWQRPYSIDGQTYTPLLDHRGFSEEGLASWYGKDFHGRKTSNGEIYDMYAMTAAHKTLPLGIFVRVENQRNGRCEVVRVNDRGPFVEGRIIDLSYTAANRLGVVGPGTAPVRITALGYESTDRSGQTHYTLPDSVLHGPFTVQVGAFTVQQNALRLCQELKKQYGVADWREAQVNGQRFYRVRSGLYSSLDEAEQARIRLRSEGFAQSFVVAVD